MDTTRPIRMQVHGSEDRRIDGILALIEESSRVAPLPDVLQRMCAEVQSIAHAEVVSVYVREQEEGRPVLVLRANVGFPREMVGNVKLELGEGITGFAAECLRPVSAAVAQKDEHYKQVPGLGEEQFPSFLSLPLVMGGKAIGVLNLQRKEDGDFTAAEVALAAALATPFTLALDRASTRGLSQDQELGRSARLSGMAIGRGHAVGKAQSAVTFRALEEPVAEGQAARDTVNAALERVADQVTRTSARLDDLLSPEHRRALAGLQVTLQDQRLLSGISDACAELGVVAGLRKVARDYVAAPYMVGVGGERLVDPWMSARAGEIEDLCVWLASEASDDTARPAGGSVLVIAERIGSFAVLSAAVRGIAAVVVGGAVEPASLAAGLARAAKIPVVAEVAGLFAWVRSGDTLLVDADQGLVRVNPSASVLVQYRYNK